MKIAIHHRLGSYSERWIKYCEREGISYKLVNCYSSDIINQLEDCFALMWHFHHNNYRDVLFAKQLLFSLEQTGKKVFPDFNTAWHFDDKVGQKYLLESINSPIVPSYVFYDQNDALNWAKRTQYPKVFKLRGGAGSENVKLINNKNQAMKIIRKSFSKGFSQFDRWGYLKERIRRVKVGLDPYIGIIKGLGRLVIPTTYAKMRGREKGYVYFQDFIPNNDYDIRVVVINNKAFAIKRIVRSNDFRASGGGQIVYEKKHFDLKTINLAFETATKLRMQCAAFDFVYDKNWNPLIIEVSYGFTMKGYDKCVGYWDKELKFHEGKFNPYGWMIENILL